MGEERTFMLRYAFFFFFSSSFENLISVMKENFYLLFRPILKKGEYLMSDKKYKFLAYILIPKNDLETLKKYKIRRQGFVFPNYRYCNDDYVFPKIFIPSVFFRFLPSSSIVGFSILKFPGIYDMRFCKYSNDRYVVVVHSLEVAEQINKYVEMLCK